MWMFCSCRKQSAETISFRSTFLKKPDTTLPITGVNQWNGVGIASRLGLTDIEQGFAGMPGFAKDPSAEQAPEARAISATVDGIRVCSVYVPNGRGIDDPHMAYKIDWLERLGSAFGDYSRHADAHPFVVGGDFNVAPLDSDAGDPLFLLPWLDPHVGQRTLRAGRVSRSCWRQ
jgi:exodeoxyribonuclease-3